MELKLKDLDRLEKLGIGGGVTFEEQMAIIKLAKENLQGSFEDVLGVMSYGTALSIYMIIMTNSNNIINNLIWLSQLLLILTIIRIAVRIFKGLKIQ